MASTAHSPRSVVSPPRSIQGPSTPAGYLISHRINDSFILINRLLKSNCDVYWLKTQITADGEALGTGSIWVPASAAARSILEQGARDLGIPIHAAAPAPTGDALKLKPIRIGLYDQYGGLMPSGWTRWLFEQFEFPFEVVYPQTLDAGDLKSRFDVLVFPDGSARFNPGGGRGGGGAQPPPDSIPAEFRSWLGRITADKTIPQLKKFAESGGAIVAIGSSTSMAELLGLPLKNYLTEKSPDGRTRPLPQEKFYIPGSILRATVDNTNPLAYGMSATADIDFDSSPVFRLEPGRGRSARRQWLGIPARRCWRAAGPGASSIWTAEPRRRWLPSARGKSSCLVPRSRSGDRRTEPSSSCSIACTTARRRRAR